MDFRCSNPSIDRVSEINTMCGFNWWRNDNDYVCDFFPIPSRLVVVGAESVSLSPIVFNPFNYVQFNKYYPRLMASIK